jgi:uncharacterized protein YcbK (DUF882 family)
MPGDKQLTPHFNLSEFRCPCCNDAIETAAQKLAEALEPVRELYGPIRIRSGFRCPKQNQKIKGAIFSQHLLGLAADLAVRGDAARYELITALLECGFKRLGIAANTVHADIGTPTGPVIWTYY